MNPARALRLQVLQSNEREGGPHGDAEGEPRNQSRDTLAVHLHSPLTIRGRSSPAKDTLEPALGSSLRR
jgi:hypothetical protein